MVMKTLNVRFYDAETAQKAAERFGGEASGVHASFQTENPDILLVRISNEFDWRDSDND